MKPHIKILPGKDGFHYCGRYPNDHYRASEGYSSFGKVSNFTPIQAMEWYWRILFYPDWYRRSPWGRGL